jgi:serine/threonine protein kinase
MYHPESSTRRDFAAPNTRLPLTSLHRRRGNAVVVYDATSQQLLVRDATEDHTLELENCPYCHQPLRDDFQPDRNARTSGQYRNTQHHASDGRPFMDPDYFGMLAASQRTSPSNTSPSTPTGRRLFPAAIRSGRSRDVSGASGPPSGAGFAVSEPTTTPGQGISSTAFSQGFFKQFFREQGELGRGGNGVVLLVEHVMDDVSLGNFACKRIPVGNDHAWLEKALIEVRLLKTIPHVNLVPYHWVWLEDYQPTKFGPSVPCLWILQEYCNGGDLHNYVLGPKDSPNPAQKYKEKLRRRSRPESAPAKDLRSPSKLTFEEIFTFFRDITSGLAHLHAKGYIHRDLKPSNCLLHRDGGKTRVLISDFGEVQATGAKRRNTGATGTISYCAPEVLLTQGTSQAFGDFTIKSDIFSLGMVVYFMCFGRLPYISSDGIDEDNEDLEKLRAEITAWKGFNHQTRLRADLPEKLYEYLQRLLAVDPNVRPTTAEILRSIKTDAGLRDMFSMADESPPRVSAVDSPTQRGSPAPVRRKSSVLVSRPGLSSLGRHRSEEYRAHRSPSPIKSARASGSEQNRPTTADSSMMIRPRKIDLPPSREETTIPPQQSPRLMLPPPPKRPMANAVAAIMHHPAAEPTLRVAMFVIKLLSICLPCAPFAANTWLLYPLLVFAGFDLGLLTFKPRRSLLFLGLHLTLVYTMRQRGILCEGRSRGWDVM